MSNEAFVTLATNDTYGLGALVLGRSLRRVATSKQTVCLVTTDVSQKMKEELSHVFNLVVTVDMLDSGDAANLALMSRPELGVTFTKLHAWRLVQFSKCVFLDADTLVVQNCDELFEREELSAAPDPGWPDCFNSGVFVFVPSEATFKALLDFAVAHGSFDGGDQGLLNMFFSDWATGDIRKHLPFIYNVVSSATYSYLPALKHFGSQVKIAHFLGNNKPWLRQSQAGTSSPYQRAWWSIFREDVAGRLSQDMIAARPLTATRTTSDLLPRYRFKDPWDFVRYGNEGSRQHAEHILPPILNSDSNSKTNFAKNEQLFSQLVNQSSPIVLNSFKKNEETVSPERLYLTTQTPKSRPLESSRHLNYGVENMKKRNNMQSKVTGCNINYPIGTSESQIKHSLNNNTKSFSIHAEIENSKTNSKNTTNVNSGKAINSSIDLHHLFISNNTKLNQRKEIYLIKDNNPTPLKSNQTSLSKPESVETNICTTPNITKSRTKPNDVNKVIETRGSASIINHKITRSDHYSEKKQSRNPEPSSVYQEKNTQVDSSVILAKPNLYMGSCNTIPLNVENTSIYSSGSGMPNFDSEKNHLYTPTEQQIGKIDAKIGSNCSILRVGAGSIGSKVSQYNQIGNISDKHHDLTYNVTRQTSQRPTCDENSEQINAGVAAVLARGEPDDWRREAWEAGDVDYLGRDSFDNIWKRICECVGITAQTLSAPAAPAATSAGIATKPSAPSPLADKPAEPVVAAEKPVEPVVSAEKPAEPVVAAEKPVEPVVAVEKTVEPVVAEKPAESVVAAEKPAEPVVAAEKPAEPVVAAEKPAEPVVAAEKPAEPVVAAEKPAEPVAAVEKPAEPVVAAEKSAEPVVAAEKSAEPVVAAEKPAEPVVAAEKRAEPVVAAEKPAEPIVAAEKPSEPVASAEKPAEPVAAADKPAESVVAAEKPADPVVVAEKPAEPVVDAEKPAESAVAAEKPAELVVAAEIPAEPVATAEKPTEPVVAAEKPAEPVVAAEKPVEPVITAGKTPETLPEDAPMVEKPAESTKTVEAPPQKTVEPTLVGEKSPETAVKLAETSTKPTPTDKPEEPLVPLQPTPSEPLSKSGEARIQPPLVAGDAPVCKKEPGTPTVTPPSGPASPQPADVAPEVCKLQATPSQPATPPASSHQTADAPVPPKRKQGKNGKPGKGKK